MTRPQTTRFSVHVPSRRGPKQALARRHERPRADGRRDPAHGRPRGCRIVVRVLPGEQRPRRELCVRRAARGGRRRALHRRAAAEAYVEARRFQVKKKKRKTGGGQYICIPTSSKRKHHPCYV
jgi:hypothetical protein